MCLEVALEFRLSPGGPDYDLDRFASDQDRIAGWQFVTSLSEINYQEALPGKHPWWMCPKPGHGRPNDLEIRYAYRHLIGLIDPVATCDLIQSICDAQSVGLQVGSEGQHAN